MPCKYAMNTKFLLVTLLILSVLLFVHGKTDDLINKTNLYSYLTRSKRQNGYEFRDFKMSPSLDGQAITIKVGVVFSEHASASDHMHEARNLLPAIYVAFRDALPRYNVKFVPEYQIYPDCVVNPYGGVMVHETFEAYNKTLKLLFDKQILGNLIVAPACTDDMLQTSVMTRAYPTLTVTGAAESIESTAVYDHLTRCSYNTMSQWNALFTFAVTYIWMNFAFVYDAMEQRAVSSFHSLTRYFQKNFDGMHVDFPLTQSIDIVDELKKASQSARSVVTFLIGFRSCTVYNNAAMGLYSCPALIIFILLMSGNKLRQILLAMNKIETLNIKEFVFITLDIFGTDVLASNGWKQGDENDAVAKTLYQSVVVVSLYEKTKSEAFQKLDAATRKAIGEVDELKKYRSSYGGLNYFGAAYYDCIMYAAFLYNLSKSDGLHLNRDIFEISGLIANKTIFKGGASGDMFIMASMDRSDDFALHAMIDLNTGKFGMVGLVNGTDHFNFKEIHPISWPTTDHANPANEPTCGYTGIKCPQPGPSLGLILPCIIVPVSILLTLGLLKFYRHAKEQKKLDEAWIAKWVELKIRSKDREKDKEKKMLEALTKKEFEEPVPGASMGASMGMSESMGNARIAATSFYKGQPVTIRWSKKQQLRMSGSVIRQARQIIKFEHDNLLPFLGACAEKDHVLMVYEFCNKGILYNLLDNHNVKLEWTVRFSFISDCLKGLAFIHSSSLRIHGRLNSLCCYIDSGFMLRITDYGLPSFYELTVAELWEARRDPEYRLAQVWKAPEHLVREASSQIEVINSVSVPGDIYSFGVIAQEVIMREKPFARPNVPDLDPGAITEAVKTSTIKGNSRFIPYIDPAACTTDLRDLCLRCYNLDSLKRPTVADLRKCLKDHGRFLGMTEHSNVLDTLLLQMEAQSARLQAIVEQKNHDLLNEKLRSDTLLYKILPLGIAETLKKRIRPNAESVELITLVYIDILGFNTMASESTPLQVLEFLNDLYAFFDENIARFDAYKIENRNDVTQIVSGLPLRNGILHAREIGRLALTILFKINSFKIKHRPDDQMKLRIGVHSGPVVAAVTGRKLPRYLLFGATVDICLRMLTTGEALKIQLSSMTKNVLETFGSFRMVERGEIFVKGKGAMKTYWLMGEDGNMELLELQRKFEEEDIEEDLEEMT